MSASRSVSIARFGDAAVRAEIQIVDGRRVVWIDIAGGRRHGAIGLRGAETAIRGVRLATRHQIPIVIVLDSGGADVSEGISALHGWGLLAKAIVDASGAVPILFGVAGACVSGPSLLLGIADIAVMATNAFAYVSGPGDTAAVTGEIVNRTELGGAVVHSRDSGVTCAIVDSPEDLHTFIELVLSYLPSNSLSEPPVVLVADPRARANEPILQIIPTNMNTPYDVRNIIADIADADSVLELRETYAPNLVTALVRLQGRTVGVVANQPQWRAGTLDIEASRKAARFVTWCDAFNIAILTLVDTPGFEPGRDLEWRGMIRHGAQLVHAYCDATVPRVSVIMRKAFGGAYIVMDSRGIGNDICFAWPGAQIAVMGTDGATQILGSKGLTADEYELRFLNPWQAADRGFVDDVINPATTRSAVIEAFETLALKTRNSRRRRHSNSPL